MRIKRRWWPALAAGIVTLCLAILVALFQSPKMGHTIDVAKWPPEAQEVLREAPGVPISTEQWKRINQIFARNHAQTPVVDVFTKDVLHSWYWFLVIPFGGLFLMSIVQTKKPGLRDVVLVIGPSLFFLVLILAKAA